MRKKVLTPIQNLHYTVRRNQGFSDYSDQPAGSVEASP